MSRILKKLTQVAVTNTLSTIYTAPIGKTIQITSMWMTNTNTTTDKYITIYAHGNTNTNKIVPSHLIAKEDVYILNCNMILSSGESIYASIDTGSDVNLLIYGIEE